jgi:hypothetical protein
MAEKKQYVTLSLGSFASHVTSHLLNLHDEASELDCIAHDSLHHELSSGRVVPRLVLCDSSGSAGSASFTPISPSNSNASTSDHLSPENESNVAHTDSASSTDALWSGGVEVHSAEKAFTSAFRRAVERGDSKLPDATDTLESEINSWADFLQADISSENVCFPSGVWHGASPVASYGDSADMLCASKLESVIDGVRRQTERCDRLAGIHLTPMLALPLVVLRTSAYKSLRMILATMFQLLRSDALLRLDTLVHSQLRRLRTHCRMLSSTLALASMQRCIVTCSARQRRRHNRCNSKEAASSTSLLCLLLRLTRALFRGVCMSDVKQTMLLACSICAPLVT